MAARSEAGRVGIWGASGSGKSSYLKQRLGDRARVIVFDPMAEYGRLGFKVVQHKGREDLDKVRQAMAADWRGFRIAYVPPAGQEVAALSALCWLIIRAQEGYRKTGRGAFLTLAVEELNLAFPVSGGAAKCPGFAEVCSRGRHSGIETFGLSQRLAEVDTRFRGNCSETVVFRQNGPRDVKAARDVLGVDEGQIKALADLHYIRRAGAQTAAGRVTFARPKKK